MDPYIDPLLRLSPNFLLLDFLGCESVYRQGYANLMQGEEAEMAVKLRNATALCEQLLEPALEHFGGLSVSYGFISPDLSRSIVKYQDPDKPSHHRWDLGAAADIILHQHVQQEGDAGAPIHAAFEIDALQLPYSRILTYSESPCICVAVSADEVSKGAPRKAFYENRYMGKAGAKPEYIQMPTAYRRGREIANLALNGLPHDWRGAGYPTYHGGGYRQHHHMRVSKHTMVSDWLKHYDYMPFGNRMIPPAHMSETLQDRFAAAGIIYDMFIEWTGARRLTIAAGYLPAKIENAIDCTLPWNGPQPAFSFIVARPGVYTIETFHDLASQVMEDLGQVDILDGNLLLVTVNDMNEVLNDHAKTIQPAQRTQRTRPQARTRPAARG